MERAKHWITKVQRDPGTNFRINNNTKIYSLHFKSEDYHFSESILPSAKPRLKPTAIPLVFPWTINVSQRKTMTSKVAASSQQHRCDTLGPSTDHKASGNTDEMNHTLDYTVCTSGTDTDKEVLSSKVDVLELKVKELEDKIHQAETNAAQQIFCLENIKQKEELVKFYTGFPDYATLMIF